MINFNGENMYFDNKFLLIITTKLENPKLKPEMFIKTTVINFGATFKGLEEQLLSEVMIIEKPKEEELKNENIEKISSF